MKKLFVFISVLLLVVSIVAFVRADELDDISHDLAKAKEDLDSSRKATATNEQQLNGIIAQLNNIKARIDGLEKEIGREEAQIAEGEKKIEEQKKFMDERIVSYYKNVGKATDSFLRVFLSDNLSKSLNQFFYQKSVIDDDKRTILRIAVQIQEIEDQKTKLQAEKDKLLPIKQEVDKQSQSLAEEVAKSKKYESELQHKIAALSARQQQIVAQKLSSLNIPRSAGTSSRGCSSDLTNGKDPGFSPKFGFFTYGAPHRNGLNQYGAKGRADAGQNAQQMLQDYYPNMSLKTDYDTNAKVSVDGNGDFSIEDYVKHIFEVPADWPMEALKAQAVASRTYALNSMQRNGHICTTEACQVFHPEEKGGRWNEAVEATKGWVMMDGGNPGFTQYASTHGGYILNLGKFDGSGGNPGSFAELNERAYDKQSPWFYCNWGSRSAYGGTAWLKSEEVADIANTLTLAKVDGGTTSHLCQTDQSQCGDTWDANKVKEELRSRGQTPFDSVSDVSVDWDHGSGKTTNITVNGSAGSKSFSGAEWKDFFNLRAPANIQIVGPLFNVEKR